MIPIRLKRILPLATDETIPAFRLGSFKKVEISSPMNLSQRSVWARSKSRVTYNSSPLFRQVNGLHIKPTS